MGRFCWIFYLHEFAFALGTIQSCICRRLALRVIHLVIELTRKLCHCWRRDPFVADAMTVGIEELQCQLMQRTFIRGTSGETLWELIESIFESLKLFALADRDQQLPRTVPPLPSRELMTSPRSESRQSREFSGYFWWISVRRAEAVDVPLQLHFQYWKLQPKKNVQCDKKHKRKVEQKLFKCAIHAQLSRSWHCYWKLFSFSLQVDFSLGIRCGGIDIGDVHAEINIFLLPSFLFTSCGKVKPSLNANGSHGCVTRHVTGISS